MSAKIPAGDNFYKRQRASELGMRRSRRRDVVDIKGQRFNRLVALSLAPIDISGTYTAVWLCRCDCGTYCFARVDRLRNGQKKSCGCLKKEMGYQKAIHLQNIQRQRRMGLA